MEKEELFDKIEKYLTGKMSESERAVFEKEISENEDLAIEVEFQRLDHDVINVLVEKNLRHKMAEWQPNLPAEKSLLDNPPLNIVVNNTNSSNGEAKVISLSSRFMRYAAAASVILGVILAGYWFFNKTEPQNVIVNTPTKPDTIKTTPTPSNEPLKDKVAQTPVVTQDKTIGKTANKKIEEPKESSTTPQYNNELLAYAETNFEEDKFINTNRTANESPKNDEIAVIDAFNKKDYKHALELFQKLPPNNSVKILRQKLLGNIYFKEKQFNKAAVCFQAIIDAPNNEYDIETAEWHLLLCYVANLPSKAKESKNLLNSILKNSNHDYYKKAEILKEKLKM